MRISTEFFVGDSGRAFQNYSGVFASRPEVSSVEMGSLSRIVEEVVVDAEPGSHCGVCLCSFDGEAKATRGWQSSGQAGSLSL